MSLYRQLQAGMSAKVYVIMSPAKHEVLLYFIRSLVFSELIRKLINIKSKSAIKVEGARISRLVVNVPYRMNQLYDRRL